MPPGSTIRVSGGSGGAGASAGTHDHGGAFDFNGFARGMTVAGRKMGKSLAETAERMAQMDKAARQTSLLTQGRSLWETFNIIPDEWLNDPDPPEAWRYR